MSAFAREDLAVATYTCGLAVVPHGIHYERYVKVHDLSLFCRRATANTYTRELVFLTQEPADPELALAHVFYPFVVFTVVKEIALQHI